MRPGVTLFRHQRTIIANAEELIQNGLPFYVGGNCWLIKHCKKKKKSHEATK